MKPSNLYTELLNAPKNAPVFLSQKFELDFLVKAYTFGLFPWTSKPITWWCPDPRCVLFPNEIYIQKSMKRFLNRYTIKLDTNFNSLIKLCGKNREKTWISEDFIQIYTELFEKNIAHSLEIYDENELIGGIYGLIIGKVFFGESMVSLKPNVSKIALIKLCEFLKPYDFIIDCQVYNPHLEFMGAKNISRAKFLTLLQQKVCQNTDFNSFKNIIKY
ncbi:leucyl/phenylalanyl-tRNA--protein transferase [Campylobacter sp. US33a]|uniref:leucyl/phenylalanyl-tRNA--protein transferase n=1 Tax=Campylobacter sp. US33a TaxID=2498120 RepID=UPI00106805D5|nr:leucyl/phenylalanyl-tRNA--protein transferase [Campylobacter sp. US33a]TEY04561.1 leucyl/phenylalanyl-tRNA--protein transferase [Campylobacter sp. US33a]